MSYSFDGIGDAFYYTAPVTVSGFTISTWFVRDTAASGNRVTDCLLDASNGDAITDDMWTLRVEGSDVLRLRTGDGGSVANANTANTHDDDPAWNHGCAIVTSDTSRRSVLNGDWANSGTNTVNKSPDAIDRLSIGARYDDVSPGEWFDNKIAEVAIWDAALSQSEVEALAAGDSPYAVDGANLVFYAPYRTSGAVDDVVGSLTATTVGTPTFSSDHPPVVWLPKMYHHHARAWRKG